MKNVAVSEGALDQLAAHASAYKSEAMSLRKCAIQAAYDNNHALERKCLDRAKLLDLASNMISLGVETCTKGLKNYIEGAKA